MRTPRFFDAALWPDERLKTLKPELPATGGGGMSIASQCQEGRQPLMALLRRLQVDGALIGTPSLITERVWRELKIERLRSGQGASRERPGSEPAWGDYVKATDTWLKGATTLLDALDEFPFDERTGRPRHRIPNLSHRFRDLLTRVGVAEIVEPDEAGNYPKAFLGWGGPLAFEDQEFLDALALVTGRLEAALPRIAVAAQAVQRRRGRPKGSFQNRSIRLLMRIWEEAGQEATVSNSGEQPVGLFVEFCTSAFRMLPPALRPPMANLPTLIRHACEAIPKKADHATDF